MLFYVACRCCGRLSYLSWFADTWVPLRRVSSGLRSQKSATSLPRSKTIFYSQASNLSATTPVRGRDRRDQKRGSVSSQASEASTIILSEEVGGRDGQGRSGGM